MSLATVNTRAQQGVTAASVQVEAHLANGLPAFTIVGLPEAAVKESRDRVRAAIINSQFNFPAKRITVNLAPADLPKEGGLYDLPIAIGILIASAQLEANNLAQYELAGELALSGQLRSGKGILPIALAAKKQQRKLIVAKDAQQEAQLVSGIELYAANSLLEVCAHLSGQKQLDSCSHHGKIQLDSAQSEHDFYKVRGQAHAKRALEIAAAGAHHILMSGPPGTGKSMLANCLAGILPPLSQQQAIESATVQSISNLGFKIENWQRRLTRAPHHSVSSVALVGGGSIPMPGEISLAHHNVLFLDELTEFSRQSLEALREPLETGMVTISRAARQATFPARFQLVAAMNPCPCGYYGDKYQACRCSLEKVLRYLDKLSGPLMDRIDIHIDVPRLKTSELNLSRPSTAENSASIQRRVIAAFKRQMARQQKQNSYLDSVEVEKYCKLDAKCTAIINDAIDKLNLSMRSYHRILKVSRSIADLEAAPQIKIQHLSEALGYRQTENRL